MGERMTEQSVIRVCLLAMLVWHLAVLWHLFVRDWSGWKHLRQWTKPKRRKRRPKWYKKPKPFAELTRKPVCGAYAKEEELQTSATTGTDGSLAAIGVTPEQAVADLERLAELIQTRRPEDVDELEVMHLRYIAAAPPSAGAKATTAYRLRLLYLDRWNLWPRLTRYRTWQGLHGETIDGTNNGSEREIGWWIKERYRTMRGYKRVKSAVNVSRLLAWCGNHLDRSGADLASPIA
jgi:hypothetical protein